MALLPAPNLEVARRVWFRIQSERAGPCGGLFIGGFDDTVYKHLLDNGALKNVEGLFDTFAGSACVVFVTRGLSLFRDYLAVQTSHLWWRWFGEESISLTISRDPDALTDAVLTQGVNVVTEGQQTSMMVFVDSQGFEWYLEEPWPVIQWFRIDPMLVSYLKLTRSADAGPGAGCSFRGVASSDDVASRFQDYVTDPKFRKLCRR